MPRMKFHVFLLVLFFATAKAAFPSSESELFYAVRIDGFPFVPLEYIASQENIDVTWDGVTHKALLSKDGHYATFMAGSPLVNLDGAVRPLERAPEIVRGAFLIPASWIATSWWPWTAGSDDSTSVPSTDGGAEQAGATAADETQRRFRLNRIMVDPGHGGEDTGAQSASGILEKDLALDISFLLASELKKAGFEVFLTRDSDEFISLDKRAEMVNAEKADLFLSIHANASKSASARGLEVYYLSNEADDYARAVAAYENAAASNQNTAPLAPPLIDPTVWDVILSEQRAESIMLAKEITKALGDSTHTVNRGVKGAEFRVLTNSQVPALLIEVGFLTHPEEAEQMTHPEYQESLATLITQAILQYKEEYEKTRGFTA